MKKIIFTAMNKLGYRLQLLGYRKNYFSKFIAFVLLFLTITYHLSPITSLAQQQSLLTITPSTADLKVNEPQIIALQLNSSSRISGFDLKFNTSGPVSIVDFLDSLGFGSEFNQFDARQVSEKFEGNNSRIAYVFTTQANNLPQTVTLYIKIQGSGQGQGKITLDYNNSQVLDGAGNPIQVTPLSATFNLNTSQSSQTFINPAQLPPPSYPDSAAVVNLKLKLYGSQQNPKINKLNAIAVVVGRVGEGNYETRPQPFDITPNPDGTYSGTVAFPDFKDGNKFSLMIKVDKYLLKRVCDLNPSESKLAGYVCKQPILTIRKGEDNTFDFSKISLLPGDLGLTDGFLNGYDLSIMRNNLGKNEAVNLGLADLNYDGVVDKKDFEIIQFVAANTNRRADQ